MSIKQDKGLLSRIPLDTERKYGKKIEKTSEKLEILENEFVVDTNLSANSFNAIANSTVTVALANKVNVVAGKQLSTNDFTNGYKNQLDNLNSDDFVSDNNYVHTDNNFTDEYKNASHTHANKTIIDSITNEKISSWDSKSNLKSDVIYDNESGIIGDFTTTKTTNLYDFIDIIFADSSGRTETKRVYSPNGKTIALGVSACSTTSYTTRTQMYSISDINFTAGYRHKLAVNGTGDITVTVSADVTDSDRVLVHKVIGYIL